jgi:WD40 repeat protein
VWLWDILNLAAPPQLLIAASGQDVPLATHFSPQGGFLSIVDGSNRYIINVSSGSFLPDGIISPDDQLLLKFDTSASVFEAELCVIVPYQCSENIRGMYVSSYDNPDVKPSDNLDQVSKIAWTGKNSFVVVSCASDDQSLCYVFEWYPSDGRGWDFSLIMVGRSFEYDAINDTLAVLKDANTVVVDNRTYDLSGKVDGEIVNIEWLPSLFYRE